MAAEAATLTEKIVARAAGVARVRPGEIVTVAVDLAMAHDSSSRNWRAMLAEIGAPLWDPARVVIVSDHYAPATDAESAALLNHTRAFVRDAGIAAFHDMEGICHVMLAEGGYLTPGMLLAGGDSHTPMSGAYGCLAIGFGATDMVGVAATGKTWLQVPATIRVTLDGALPAGVTAKDIMLRLCRTLGMDNAFHVVEFAGTTVDALAMDERSVLCNMATELGADSGIVAADATTAAAIARTGSYLPAIDGDWRSDDAALVVARHAVDVAALEPQVAAPHSPANSAAVGDHHDVAVSQAYIGSCAGAKLGDLRMAAAVLRGRRVAPGTRLLVAPASRTITAAASRDGTLATLLDAGATLLSSGCGACAAYGAGVLDAGDVCISTTNRNFRGRMGSRDARVFLANPYTVAASAVAGRIVDPRAMLADAA